MMFFEWIKKIKTSIILTAILIFIHAGFGGFTVAGAQTSLPEKKLEGRIRVSGAWALYPMMVTWAEEFKKIHPGVRIDISAGGAGKGVTDALSGLVDIGMVSRDLRPEELKQKAFYVPVVKDAVFPTINAANPVMKELMEKGLRKTDFIDLWLSARSMTWGVLTATDNSRKVRVYTRSDSCGAAETWAKYLGAYQEDLKGIAVYGDPGIAEAIRKDKNGIGYNNLNYAYDIKTGLPVPGIRMVPIDVNGNGLIDPKEKLDTKQDAIDAVQSGVYPSPPARDLYLVTKGAFQGTTKEFVKWILSDGQRYVDEVGYLKINASQIKNAVQKVGH
ncbi:MAG: substrate-binding domain-containing protein [Smithella sp.]|nr:substrate-binding domain-containing protein [Smithella sp.]